MYYDLKVVFVKEEDGYTAHIVNVGDKILERVQAAFSIRVTTTEDKAIVDISEAGKGGSSPVQFTVDKVATVVQKSILEYVTQRRGLVL